jgi:hypothetical protein
MHQAQTPLSTLSAAAMQAHRELTLASLCQKASAFVPIGETRRAREQSSPVAMASSKVVSTKTSASTTNHVAHFEYADGSSETFDGRVWAKTAAPKTAN